MQELHARLEDHVTTAQNASKKIADTSRATAMREMRQIMVHIMKGAVAMRIEVWRNSARQARWDDVLAKSKRDNREEMDAARDNFKLLQFEDCH